MARGRWAMGTTNRWPPRRNSREAIQARKFRSCWTYTVALAFLLLLLILGLRHPASSQFFLDIHSMSASSLASSPCPQCSSRPPTSVQMLAPGEKFLWYTPHSGFSNQVMELKNALAIASLVNRTLIVPPVLDHHALALGSCPKNKLLHTVDQMRTLAWAEFSGLIRNSRISLPPYIMMHGTHSLAEKIVAAVMRNKKRSNLAKVSEIVIKVCCSGPLVPRYVSMADIVDLSAVTPKLVRTIDLRTFVALWCGVDIRPACFGPSCKRLAKLAAPAWGSLESCGALLSQAVPQPHCCVHGVQDDCTTTLWTCGAEHDAAEANEGGTRLLAQEVVAGDKRSKQKVTKDILKSLGPGSVAADAVVLSFGSLFSMQYKQVQTHIDIKTPSGNTKVDELIEASKYLPFSSDIVEAGKKFVQESIGQPFFCAQLRLLDGQFKNRWEKTFSHLQDKLEKLHKHGSKKKQKVVVFVMTDLPTKQWQGIFLGQLSSNNSYYKVRTLSAKKEPVSTAARNVITKELGFRSGFLPQNSGSHAKSSKGGKFVPDVLLNIQQVVCSCASLGFAGTSGSTLTDAISDMRAVGLC